MAAHKKLTDAIAEDLREAWWAFGNDFPKDKAYAVGLYTTPDGDYFIPFILGEDGLNQVAEKYAKGKTSEIEKQTRELR